MNSETITINSDITSSTVDPLLREVNSLIETGQSDIVFDLTHVAVVDSTGIGFMIRVQNSLRQKNGGLTLSNVNEDILKMMKIMRLDRHFIVEE